MSYLCDVSCVNMTKKEEKKKKKRKTMNNTMIEYSEGNHTYYVYIITNKHRTTYYIGMTNNLGVSLQQHKEKH
jgi:hypothetical protein